MPTVSGYELHAVLGRGATGVVYDARDGRGRRVAVKLLDAALARDDAVRARLAREAAVLRVLHDDHCVQLIDYVDADEPFLVLELVDGASLRAVLGQARLLAPADVVGVMRDVLDGLGAAHDRGVLHRDVKPENVLVDRRGRAKLADFGLARTRVDASQPLGVAEGTPSFMSPEQVRGDVLDARSDLYAAGCLLYELLAGTPVFTRESASAVMAAQLHDAPMLDALPVALASVTGRALAKDPGDRFGDAREFRDALDAAARRSYAPALLAGGGSLAGIVAGVLSDTERGAATVRRRRVTRTHAIVAASAVAVATTAAVTLSGALGGSSSHRAGTTTAAALASSAATVASVSTTSGVTTTTTPPAVDPCLVGRWVLTTPVNGGFYTSTSGGSGTLLGGVGLVRTVTSDGREQYDYSSGGPYVSGAFSVKMTGVASDVLGARGGRESLVAKSARSTVRTTIVSKPSGSSGIGTMPPFPSPGAVTYTCRPGGITEHSRTGTFQWSGG